MKQNIWNIQKNDRGRKLLSYLKEQISNLSLKELKWAIEHNFCVVNGVPERFASSLLNEGDQIHFNYIYNLKHSIEQIQPSRIIYEDQYLLAYNKPPFLPSVGPHSLELLLKAEFPSLFPVHRLDRDTTGVLLFAKNAKSKEIIEVAFKNRIVKKSYLAVINGTPRISKGIIKSYLGEVKKVPGKITYGVVSKDRGLWSETEWNLVKELVFEGSQLSLVRCFPLTGRTHQIRVHLKSIGYPLLCDYQYGGSLKPYFPHYFLHAESLSLPLSFYSKPLFIQAPLPENFISIGSQ